MTMGYKTNAETVIRLLNEAPLLHDRRDQFSPREGEVSPACD